MMKNKDYITIPELAKLLGISRIAVYKKVKSGKIKAAKVGRNFAIPASQADGLLGGALKEKDKQEIELAVKKVVKEYGETLKLLGNG
ncbi:MAG: excisionase family DNA-binding protein [Elusimicrobiota bacterium]